MLTVTTIAKKNSTAHFTHLFFCQHTNPTLKNKRVKFSERYRQKFKKDSYIWTINVLKLKSRTKTTE